MFTAYVVVTVITAVINAFSASANFLRLRPVRDGMTQIGVPHSWIIPLGLCKAAGATGLIVGFIVPTIGVAAAIGLVLFFIGAIAAHVRGGHRAIWLPMIFLALAVSSLVLRLAV